MHITVKVASPEWMSCCAAEEHVWAACHIWDYSKTEILYLYLLEWTCQPHWIYNDVTSLTANVLFAWYLILRRFIKVPFYSLMFSIIELLNYWCQHEVEPCWRETTAKSRVWADSEPEHQRSFTACATHDLDCMLLLGTRTCTRL